MDLPDIMSGYPPLTRPIPPQPQKNNLSKEVSSPITSSTSSQNAQQDNLLNTCFSPPATTFPAQSFLSPLSSSSSDPYQSPPTLAGRISSHPPALHVHTNTDGPSATWLARAERLRQVQSSAFPRQTELSPSTSPFNDLSHTLSPHDHPRTHAPPSSQPSSLTSPRMQRVVSRKHSSPFSGQQSSFASPPSSYNTPHSTSHLAIHDPDTDTPILTPTRPSPSSSLYLPLSGCSSVGSVCGDGDGDGNGDDRLTGGIIVDEPLYCSQSQTHTPIHMGLQLDLGDTGSLSSSNLGLSSTNPSLGLSSTNISLAQSFEISSQGTLKLRDKRRNSSIQISRGGEVVVNRTRFTQNSPNGLDSIAEDTDINPQLEDDAVQCNFIGQRVKSNHLLPLGELGRGVSALVLKALLWPAMQIVAVKSLHMFDHPSRSQFKNELSVFVHAHCHNVLSLIGGYFEDGYVTLVLEHMNRGDLNSILNKYGPLSEGVLRYLALEVCKGLHGLHKHKLIHRDLKPHNILVDCKGNVKIADFGLARQLRNACDATLSVGGTIAYLSPERVIDNTTTVAGDVWGLGLSLLTLATGSVKVPQEYWALMSFLSQPAEQWGLDLDPTKFSTECREFIHACLNGDHLQRPSSATLLSHPWLHPQAIKNMGQWTTEVNQAFKITNTTTYGVGIHPPEPISAAELPWCKLTIPNKQDVEPLLNALSSTVYNNKQEWSLDDLQDLQALSLQMGWEWEHWKVYLQDWFNIAIGPNYIHNQGMGVK